MHTHLKKKAVKKKPRKNLRLRKEELFETWKKHLTVK